MNTTVRNFLIELARNKANPTITYQVLSDKCGLKLNMRDNPHDRKILGQILGEISEYEHINDRPLLSALVIRAGDNYEGDGFYKLAEELGYGNWQKLKQEGEFEIKQMNECIDFWSNDEKYLKNK